MDACLILVVGGALVESVEGFLFAERGVLVVTKSDPWIKSAVLVFQLVLEMMMALYLQSEHTHGAT